MSILKIENLSKIYGTGEAAITALDHLNLSIETGEFVAVMGPSGCGKSTLLQLAGGLDKPSEGKIWLDGHDLAALKDDELTSMRRRRIGFVFQFYNLLPVLNAEENAALPLILDGVRHAEALSRAREWLERFGLGARLNHRPSQLSGGQQQRVAIARALCPEPALILADEPTGNLDSRASDEIVDLLRKVSAEYGRAVLMVTHDPRLAAYADRIIFLKDGRIVNETRLEGEAGDAAKLRETVEAL
ncbi:MAG TPA: ABC transporter ATP-binding protein [Anaerolineaceae bacterium]|nr:ABC transporter ATP-binding protein [Anaerolineaceae bacterium]